MSLVPGASAPKRAVVSRAYANDARFSCPSTLSLSVVGLVRSPYVERFGTPRQPFADHGERVGDAVVHARVELCAPATSQCLRGLEAFEYCWLVTFFHLNRGWSALVHPPRAPAGKYGVFSTRSPHRPNSVGLSCVRVERVDEAAGVLHFSGCDLLEGTAVIDIKPYVPYCDSFPGARAGWLDALDGRGAPLSPAGGEGGEEGFDAAVAAASRASGGGAESKKTTEAGAASGGDCDSGGGGTKRSIASSSGGCSDAAPAALAAADKNREKQHQKKANPKKKPRGGVRQNSVSQIPPDGSIASNSGAPEERVDAFGPGLAAEEGTMQAETTGTVDAVGTPPALAFQSTTPSATSVHGANAGVAAARGTIEPAASPSSVEEHWLLRERVLAPLLHVACTGAFLLLLLFAPRSLPLRQSSGAGGG